MRRKRTNVFGGKTMTTWLNDDKRIRGITARNVKYIRELKELLPEFGRVGVLTYFLLTRLGMEDVRSMLQSQVKQKALIWSVIKDLKEWAVTQDYEQAFDRNITSLRRRVEYVFYICKEDLRLTEHYPYFSEVGFEKLLDFELVYTGKNESALDVLIPDMEAWETEHQAEIEKHMESIRPELEARDRHKAEIKLKEKAEKEALKAQKKAEKDEIKLIKENRRREEIARRKWEKEMETTMRHVGGMPE